MAGCNSPVKNATLSDCQADVVLAGANGPYSAAMVSVKSAIRTVPVRSPALKIMSFTLAGKQMGNKRCQFNLSHGRNELTLFSTQTIPG